MYPRCNPLNRTGYSPLAASRSASHALVGWLFILLIALLTISANARSAAASADPTEPLPHLGSSSSNAALLDERQAARLIQQAATTLAASQPQQQAKTQLAATTSSLINQQSERWLGQFGRARATLGIDQHFKKFSGGLALLIPLDDSCRNLLTFSQLGFHYHDQQPIVNLGLGQRYQVADWLLGYNAFVDQNVRRSHSRWGLGAEAWRDYLLFSGNGYFPISRWKASKQLEGYEEKPARGFDVRAQFYWPSYRHLGGKLQYEHYFGDEVGLFGKEKRQKNPLAFTIGVDYTPVPLLTLGVDHRIGREKHHDTRVKLQLDYAFCSPWAHQIDATRVTAQRSLEANRYNWVQRNEQMVMQYRQLPALTLSLPDTLNGYPGELKQLDATVTARVGFKQMSWQAAEFYAAGGKIALSSGTQYQLTLPTAPGRYLLTGTAIDQQDHRSQPASTTVVVEAPITLSLPPSLSGKPGNPVTLEATINAHFGFKALQWDDKALKALTDAGGKLEAIEGETAKWQITLPKTTGTYALSGIAVDQQDNQSLPASVNLIVTETPQPEELVLTLEPAALSGKPGEKFTITASVATGFTKIKWYDDAKQRALDGMVEALDPEGTTKLQRRYEVTLPNNSRTLSAEAIDADNRESALVDLKLTITQEPLTIKLADDKPLPTVWLAGGELQLKASGGTEPYTWKSGNHGAKVDSAGLVTLLQNGHQGDTITVTDSNNQSGTFELPAQPLLQAIEPPQRAYLEGNSYCKNLAGKLPELVKLQDAYNQWPSMLTWARDIFQTSPTDKELSVWVDTPDANENDQQATVLDLKSNTPSFDSDALQPHNLICLFESN